MNTPQRTRAPRAAAAIHGARDARQRIATRARFVRIMAAQLDVIAPGTIRVAVAPVTVEDRTRTWVELTDADGRALTADRAAHRAAHGLLTRAFPAADWSVPRIYDARTGDLTVNNHAAPTALGLDDVEEAGQ
ncbi:hypothetical protein ABZ368_19350 [Streptomyces sp. NPDC005908]|uniref:hypothetical protein n=1 Tax=Streptomyces sp. NPDC005908 TaxID=3157084 RepID=UPI00340BCACB